MKEFKITAIVLILGTVFFAVPSGAKSPGIFLQEGLYAEETEGDLDKAIEIYKQIVENTDTYQRIAARATYQLGICYLKKGENKKAAEYFEEVASRYPEQKTIVKIAQKQLEKVSSVDDIIAKSYVIHYKALDQSQDALELFNKQHPKGVKTHHANRYKKNGETINSICTDTKEGKEKIVAVIEDSDELKLVKVVPPTGQTKESVFEQIDYQIIRFISEKFGETAMGAGQQHLAVNSHIYYVDQEGFCYKGGMNYYYNWTGKTITQKVRFGGTDYPDQTHYGVDGNILNTEIVPDKTRSNHWQIYWVPDEPLAPEEYLYYGWSMNNKQKISKLPGDVYSLIMDNKYGSPAVETFFLVLPKDLKISKSNSPTGSQELLNFNVYWWTKKVQQGENHLEQVQLTKAPLSQEIDSLIKQLGEKEEQPFTALNKLINIGKPAVNPLIARMNESNNWQVPKALGAIKDKRAVGPLIEKLHKSNFSPMKEVICEALGFITEKDYGEDRQKWLKWGEENAAFYTPADTIRNFMAAAIKLDSNNAMSFVAPDSHDYNDIKEIFENTEHPFNIMFRKLDASKPVKIVETNIIDTMCSAVWQVTFKEEFTIEGKTFKIGETLDLGGNLHKYRDKWLITGI